MIINIKVIDLEEDKKDFERQVNELKAKIDQIEKRNSEQRAAEEKKHAEDIAFYKKTNQQLKVMYNNKIVSCERRAIFNQLSAEIINQVNTHPSNIFDWK